MRMDQVTRYRRAVQFRVLGPLEVDAGDGPVPLGGPKQRAVLASLLIRANQVVPTDHLIDEIWGDDPPEKARNTLQTYVSSLRGSLGDDRLQGRSPGYVLLLDPTELDATRFDSLVRDAKKAMTVDPGIAITTLDDALGLWRGPALADLADRPSLLAEAARLDELRLEAQEHRIEGLLASGMDARAVGELETLVVQLPLREGLWGLLMLALYRNGRQADALHAFQRAREILAEQLGIDPSAELVRLHERILRHDPALDLRGEPLRGYRLLEKLGDGPDGAVFRAIQPHVGRDVAVKVFREAVAADPSFVRRFELDAQAAAALEHPHVVPTYDAWRELGRAYVVSRYLRGGSLRALQAREEPMTSERAVRIVEQVASALAFAHRQGVTHGNVGGSNVLFDADGNAYLGDFAVRSATVVDMQDDVRRLARLIRELLGARMPDRMLELVAAAELGSGGADASRLADGARAMLGPSAVADEVRADVRNPYKGLRAFTESDAGDFFGRDALVDRLIARLVEPHPGARFLAVVGPSGGGKSSVVRAGLVPAIRRGALGEGDRFVADMLPGTHPIEELEAALLRVAVRAASRVRDTLEAGSRGLLEAVDLVAPDGAEVVLVIDQFEELFTLTSNERERALFLDSLRVACVDPESRVQVIATMRADFFDRPLVYPRFGELLAARTEAVPPLTPDELEQAIRRPAERAGVHPDPGLEAAMIADVADQPGALPLVQYALTELFERRAGDRLTLDAYREIGGVAGALSARAERCYRDADPGVQRVTRQVLLRLVALGEGSRDTRRRVARSELDALDVDPAHIDEVLDTLGRHRLLTFDREPSTREPTVEVAHEALLGAWARLRAWIDEARDDLRHDERLARAASEWQGSGRDPSFLLRGARLEQVESWSATADLAIGRPQREFVGASIERRAVDRAVEVERREQEIRTERRARGRLRALVAVFAVAALVAGGLTIVATDQSQRAASVARIARARALAAAAISTLEQDPERSVTLAVAAVRETRSVDGSVIPEAEEALHRAIVTSRVVTTVPGVGGEVAWSPSGSFAAVGGDGQGTIVIGDAMTGEIEHRLETHDGMVTGLAFSTDGARLASTGADGALRLWDADSLTLIATVGGSGTAMGPDFSADGSVVAAGWEERGTIRTIDAGSGRVNGSMRSNGASAITLSPDGRTVAFARGPSLAVVDVTTGLPRFAPIPVPFGAGTLAWSPDGRYIASGGIPGAMIWSARTGDLLDELPGHPSVSALAWGPDSATLLSGSDEVPGVTVWSIRDGVADERLTLSSTETDRGVGGVAVSPDGTHVMAGAADHGAVKVWDLSDAGAAEWANIPTVKEFGDVAFQPDGDLVAADAQGDIRVHDLESGETSPPIGPPVKEHWFALSPDGTTIAIAYSHEAVRFRRQTRVWDTDTGQRLPTSPVVQHAEGVAWSAESTVLAVASPDRRATLVVDRSGAVVAELPDRTSEGITGTSFSPDGRLLATIGGGQGDGSLIAIWDWRREELLRTMRTEPAEGLTFDPTGSYVVTMFGAPVVWDVRSGTRVGALEISPGRVGTVAVSPDGRRIAAPVSNGVGLFDSGSGHRIVTLPSPDLRHPYRLAFSADGSMLATQAPSTLGGPGVVRVWAIDIDDLLTIARREVTRADAGS